MQNIESQRVLNSKTSKSAAKNTLGDAQKNAPKSTYIHIPFCRKKCAYCAFTSFAGLNFINDYVKKLTSEIKHFYKGSPLETLYIGGGTPSLLEIKHFEKILSLFNFAPGAEITVELNPESTDLKLLSALYKMGVNRLSIGVQTFDEDILKDIGRLHTVKKAKDTVYLAQDTGFENISIDLIYGLPKQNLKLWEFDLKEALGLDIQHISLYGLKIEEGTLFYKQKPKHLQDDSIQDDLQADMYEFAVSFLEKEGFKLYEISNFAKQSAEETTKNTSNQNTEQSGKNLPEFASRHNLNYWNEGEYFGFGISASGFVCGTRYQNTTNFKEYMENKLPTRETSILTDQERLEETIFLGFRKRDGINIYNINEKFNIDFDQKYAAIIKKFLNSGHLEKTQNGYRLTLSGILVSNLILSEFLC